MFRSGLVILVGAASLLIWTTRTPAQADDLPFVSIALPPSVPSESVQVSYFLVGPFGGCGGYVAQQFNVTSYQIPTTVDGKRATEIRAIVYASGCEIQKLVIPLTAQSPISRELACQPVQTIRLSGQIVPNELAKYGNAELVVTYMAWWAHGFFGIVDGIVTELRLAVVTPDANGSFQIDLPYFTADAESSSSMQRASISFMLRDSKTWNHIASNLEPGVPEFRSENHSLRIQSHYPSGLKFTAGPF